MTTFTEKVEELLVRYSGAWGIAYNEIDPHNDDKHPNYDGMSKVEVRSKEIEHEAKQALLKAHQAEISRVLERVKKAVDGLEIDLEATREHMLSKGATESQILNMEIEADDRTEILNDVRQAINKIKGEYK